jgi:hypothetical protein
MHSYPPSLIKLLGRLQRLRRLEVVTKYQLGVEQALQLTDHVQTLDPGVVVTRQPAMGMAELVVLGNVELIRRPDEGTVLLQVDLHDDQAGGVSRRVVQGDALGEVVVVVSERGPLQLLQVHVVCQIHSQVGARADGPASVLELLLVHVDGYIGADEVLQATSVVQMQMSDDDSFDIFDVISGRLDCFGKLLVLTILDTREDVRQGSAPFLCHGQPSFIEIAFEVKDVHIRHQCPPRSLSRTKSNQGRDARSEQPERSTSGAWSRDSYCSTWRCLHLEGA